MLIEEHIADHNTKSICGREVQKSLAQSMKALIEVKIKTLDVGNLFDIQRSVIRSQTGDGIIVFEGLQDHTAESIKSFEGFNRILIEEAQSVSQRSLDLLRPTIRAENSEIWAIWNPDSPTDPIDALLRGPNPPADSIVRKVNHSDNPWFPDVLMDEMEYDKSRDFDKYLHVWEGGYLTNSEKRIFKNWKIFDFETPKDASFYFGLDFGFAKDPTALVRLYIEGRKMFIDYEAYEVGCEIVDTPHLLLTVPESENHPITADSSRPETISHLSKNGFKKIRASIKGKGSIVEGIEFLKSYDIFIHPRCKKLIEDFTFYSYKVNSKTLEITNVIDEMHADGPDACRYAIELLRRTAPPKQVDFTPIPTQNRW